MLTPNQAAAQAIHLFSQEARLCDAQPSKVARTSEGDNDESHKAGSTASDDMAQPSSASHSAPSSAPGHSGLLQSKLSTKHEGELYSAGCAYTSLRKMFTNSS